MPEPQYDAGGSHRRRPATGGAAGPGHRARRRRWRRRPGGAATGTGPVRQAPQPLVRRLARPAPQPRLHHLRAGHPLPGVIAIWPQLIATGNPLQCDLAKAQEGSAARPPLRLRQPGLRRLHPHRLRRPRLHHRRRLRHPRASRSLGGLLGGLAGFFGGWWDSLLSRITDIFFGIPVVLGGLVFLSVVTSTTVWPVVGFIVLLGWPQISRIARGSVITAKQNDYVQAARALGAGNARMLLRHIAPNAVAPVIVVATIALGTYIALEATLSYLGVGPEAADRLLGHRHLRRLHLHPQRPAHAAVARGRAEHHRARVHHARRRGARRPRPQAALRSRHDDPATPAARSARSARGVPHPGRRRQGRQRRQLHASTQGETLAVLGESGSGKSVTAQADHGHPRHAARARSPAARSSSRGADLLKLKAGGAAQDPRRRRWR